jgi:predicted nucleic acid-binding protein
MRILLDTSVFVAALVSAHPDHSRALPWLQRVAEGNVTGIAAAHTIAEIYAILTALPVRPRISPQAAVELIKRNVIDTFDVVSLEAEGYWALVERLSDLGIVGGATYDAIILRVASEQNVDQVVTLNVKDFRRVDPEMAKRIIAP